MEFSIGLIEVSALGHAIYVLDAMTKAANVEFVATERRLGGRLVTLVVKGEISAVTAAVEAGVQTAKEFGCLKAAEVIARPHKEILKFLNLDEKKKVSARSESAATHVGSPKEPSNAANKSDSKAAKAASDKKAAPTRGRKKGESLKK